MAGRSNASLAQRSVPFLLDAGLNLRRALPTELTLGDLLECNREGLGVVAETGDLGRDEIPDSLTQLVVVGVDLPCSLGGQDDQRVAAVDLVRELFDSGIYQRVPYSG